MTSKSEHLAADATGSSTPFVKDGFTDVNGWFELLDELEVSAKCPTLGMLESVTFIIETKTTESQHAPAIALELADNELTSIKTEALLFSGDVSAARARVLHNGTPGHLVRVFIYTTD